jgi:5,10-methylenetetrahydrofolate reductase
MGVPGYPEKHFEAHSMEFDLQKTKAKVVAGENI